MTIGYGTRRGKLYYLDWAPDSEVKGGQAFTTSGERDKIWLWHKRLGHASFGYLKKLFPSLFFSLDVSSFQCDMCELAKSHRVPFPLSSNKSLVPFSLVHSDVWGPAKIVTLARARWFVTFIDDCTCMTWVSLLKPKEEVSSRFQQFYQMVKTQFQARIQVLRFDNGGEFLNHDLSQFLQDHGIIHQCSFPYSPQQYGVAERKNKHLLEAVRASLFGANMPRFFWSEAVVSAAYCINRIPSNILNFKTPLQTLHHHIQTPPTPNLEPRIFGCVVFVHLHDHQRSKLDSRVEKYVFIGYAPHQKGYRCYHSPSQKVYTSMDVVFQKHNIYFSAAQEEHCDTNTSQIFNLFPPESSQPESNRSLMTLLENCRSLMTLPENDRSQLESYRSLPENQPQPDMSSPCCPTQEEETDEILPTSETLQLQYHTNHLLRMSFR
ncbi:hypothetical protein L3X38_012358 [Prunus dulcis]|uniref:Integrase catalytic domain-containing protein n=1 Tax=Prunus dulcis TaxID=3755 RepID=A0AAD4ZGA9_PRUDU|nr:hypothetical protein L3X38_012358 [Prunus dulcis]